MTLSRYCVTINSFRSFSSIPRNFREIKIKVPWGHIAGKWWGPYDKRPILSIHGWQDNCGAFDRLIPILTRNTGILAIDLPGHGYSSKVPPGTFYHFTHTLALLRYIHKHFQWKKMSLMGHSLGGITCYTYNMAFPESVDFVICIDAFKPPVWGNNIPKLTSSIDDLLKYDQLESDPGEPPSYPMDELKKKVAAAQEGSINIEYSHHILNRNIAQSKKDPSKYCFTRDNRLKPLMDTFPTIPQDELLEGAKRIGNPIMIIKQTDSPYWEEKSKIYDVVDVLRETSTGFKYHYAKGTHHGFLNDPQNMSEQISDFIEEYGREDRSFVGVSEGIIV